MDIKRYHEICKQLDPSLASMLNLIRRYVQANQASVMVGSGFSKNADMNPGVKMKEWNELGVEFYKHLYAKDNPGKEDFYFKSPIRLASQYATFTTHAELDKIISDSLPDNAINPGELHKKLMQLPWRDVFTTNYDTLLEKTKPYWKQSYTVVKNRETLIYSTSPRIIKLHGSFPDQHPYIMTEEDFRTYPQIHPEFVNTVRQSLIENLFCLIGFSGDDDNFRSWIGWLRDVIGKDSVMCYMITYNNNWHDSEVSLIESRGITIVNLNRLPLKGNEGYADALDFFLTFITPEDKSEEVEWSGKLDEWPYEDLERATKMMRSIRESYPGWPYLPEKHLRDFRDVEQRAPFLESKFNVLSEEQKYAFAIELLWRIRISYSPLIFEWLIRYVESVVAKEDIRKPKITDMALMLLSSYRLTGDFDLFEKLSERLDPIEDYGTSMQIHTYAYELALSYALMLNMQDLKKLLQKWNVQAEDTIPTLWKANMQTFVGDIDEAKVSLQAALQFIEKKSRNGFTDNLLMLKDVLQTASYSIGASEGTYMRPENSLYVSYSNNLKMSLIDYEKNGRATQQYIHTFNIGKRYRKWTSGSSGIFGDYIYPYRYLTMRDRLGVPIGTNHNGIDLENLKLFLGAFMKYEPTYSMSYVIRSKKDEVVKSVVTRDFLHNWPKDKCEDLYKSSFSQVFKNPKTMTEERLRSNVLIPLFSRMCIRFRQETILDVFDTILDYCSKQKRYDALREEMSIIYDCADEERVVYMMQRCLKSPIPEKSYDEVMIPNCLLEHIEIQDDVVNYLISALGNPSSDKRVVLTRILCSLRWLNESQRELIQKAVIDWRENKTGDLVLSTFQLLEPTEEEKTKVEECCISIVGELSQCAWQNGNSTDEKDKIIAVLQNIVRMANYFTLSQLQDIYGYLNRLLHEVYDKVPVSPNTSLDEDYYYSYFESVFKRIIRRTAERMQKTPLAETLRKKIDEVDKKNHTYLEPKLRLYIPSQVRDSEKQLRTQIGKRLSSKSNDVSEDGIQSLKYCLPYCRNIILAYGSTFTYIKRTSEERLVLYLQYSAELLKYDAAEKVIDYFGTMLDAMHEIVEDNKLSFEFKTDVIYYVGHIAGILNEKNVDPKGEVTRWKEYLDSPEIDADVHNSFQQGRLMYRNRNI